LLQRLFPQFLSFLNFFSSCRFHINLQCGSHSGADVALHFNPRYDGSAYVVKNTYQNRNWGSEERKYESPFPQGQTFTLQILVALDAYKVQDHSLSDFLFLKRFWMALVLMSSFFHFYQQNDILLIIGEAFHLLSLMVLSRYLLMGDTSWTLNTVFPFLGWTPLQWREWWSWILLHSRILRWEQSTHAATAKLPLN